MRAPAQTQAQSRQRADTRGDLVFGKVSHPKQCSTVHSRADVHEITTVTRPARVHKRGVNSVVNNTPPHRLQGQLRHSATGQLRHFENAATGQLPARCVLNRTLTQVRHMGPPHGAGNDRKEAHLPVGPAEGLDHGQDGMTPRQRALHVARERMQICLLYTSPSPRD